MMGYGLCERYVNGQGTYGNTMRGMAYVLGWSMGRYVTHA